MVSTTVGPQSLSSAVLSPTSVHLTWVTPCHTQQYHIYYNGTCGAYVDEGRLDTDHQEHTFDELQEGTNYTFIVNQTGLSGGRVFSIGPVYARTFTAGMTKRLLMNLRLPNYSISYLFSPLRSSTVTGGHVCTTH